MIEEIKISNLYEYNKDINDLEKLSEFFTMYFRKYTCYNNETKIVISGTKYYNYPAEKLNLKAENGEIYEMSESGFWKELKGEFRKYEILRCGKKNLNPDTNKEFTKIIQRFSRYLYVEVVDNDYVFFKNDYSKIKISDMGNGFLMLRSIITQILMAIEKKKKYFILSRRLNDFLDQYNQADLIEFIRNIKDKIEVIYD